MYRIARITGPAALFTCARSLKNSDGKFMAFTAVCVISLIFWTCVSAITGVAEPWDLATYWTIIYPAALALSVIMGAVLKRSQWSAGAIVMFAQIPVTLASSGAAAMLGAGIFYAAIISIPAIALSWFAGRLRQAHSSK